MTFSFLHCLADCLLGTLTYRQLSHILIIWSKTIDDTEYIFASLRKYLIENMWALIWKGGNIYGVSRIQRALLYALHCPPTSYLLFLTELALMLGSLEVLPFLPVNEHISHYSFCSHWFWSLNQIIFAIIQLKEKYNLFIVKCYKTFWYPLSSPNPKSFGLILFYNICLSS